MAYFKDMIYFEKVPRIGDLYLDKILFEYENDPMIFICKEEYTFSRPYLCICNDNIQEYSWIVVAITDEILEKLISGDITIMTPFKETKEEVLLVNRKFGNPTCSYKWCRYEDIDKGELPVKDQYLSVKEGKEMNERDVFESELKMVLDYLTKALRYTDECSDLEEFTYSLDFSKIEIAMNITAHFTDGGTKKIATTGINMYGIITDIISCITGPRHYDMDTPKVISTLTEMKQKHDLSGLENAAINQVIKYLSNGTLVYDEGE